MMPARQHVTPLRRAPKLRFVEVRGLLSTTGPTNFTRGFANTLASAYIGTGGRVLYSQAKSGRAFPLCPDTSHVDFLRAALRTSRAARRRMRLALITGAPGVRTFDAGSGVARRRRFSWSASVANTQMGAVGDTRRCFTRRFAHVADSHHTGTVTGS